MQIFIDTADIEKIREAAGWGLVDGVTTNPTLLSKVGAGESSFKQVVGEICEVVDGPISAEVTSTDALGMVKEAKELSEIHPNVVVKIPMTKEGMKACKELAKMGIKTNVTLVFSPSQGLIAAKQKATYVSPFVGRLDDRSGDGMDVVAQIITIYENYGFNTKVLVASIRHPRHVLEAALMGADAATVPYEVLKKLFDHPLTDMGLKRFMADWAKVE